MSDEVDTDFSRLYVTIEGTEVHSGQIWENRVGRQVKVQGRWVGRNGLSVVGYVNVYPIYLHSKITGKYQRASKLRIDMMHKNWKLVQDVKP